MFSSSINSSCDVKDCGKIQRGVRCHPHLRRVIDSVKLRHIGAHMSSKHAIECQAECIESKCCKKEEVSAGWASGSLVV